MLIVKNVVKNYKKKNILNGVSFEITPGEIVGIIGSNGCGKTTLLSIIAGINKPDKGQVFLDETDIFKNKDIAEIIAFVPQENPIIPELDAYDNYKLWFRGNKKELKESLDHGIGKQMGVSDFLYTKAGKLSGGQKKRLNIATALTKTSRLLVMDEPGAALDIKTKQDILKYLKEFSRNGGSVILASHEEQEIRICDRLFIMKNGLLYPVADYSDALEKLYNQEDFYE